LRQQPAEENPKEEKGISNRRFQGVFIPPLTNANALYKMLQIRIDTTTPM
jgi:hypothetical protein